MIFFEYLLLGTALLFNFFFLYYLLLAIAGFWPRSLPEKKEPPDSDLRFCFLIPAHNEEKVIKLTLNNLQRLSYPTEQYDIVVVADNCSDNTVSIVRDAGVHCLERNDPANPGKGQALNWALPQLLHHGGPDAFVIIDADSLAAPNILAVFSHYIKNGEKIIQGRYDVLNPAASVSASFAFFSFAISQNLQYRGRSRLGWSVTLLGNGMCLTNDIIKKFGWQAFSISEDLEYQLQLLLKGIKVFFADETGVSAEMPTSFKSFHQQRSRWDIGRYRLRNQYVPMFLKRALIEQRLSFLDAVLDLTIPPYTLYVGTSFFCLIVHMLLFYQQPDLHFYLWIMLNGGLIVYTITGLLIAGPPAKVVVNLLYAPLYLLLKIGIACQSIFVKGTKWVKTERN